MVIIISTIYWLSYNRTNRTQQAIQTPTHQDRFSFCNIKILSLKCSFNKNEGFVYNFRYACLQWTSEKQYNLNTSWYGMAGWNQRQWFLFLQAKNCAATDYDLFFLNFQNSLSDFNIFQINLVWNCDNTGTSHLMVGFSNRTKSET